MHGATMKISRRVLEKCSNVKFHEYPSSGSQVVPCGRTDRQTDMMTLIVAFPNSASESKNKEHKIYALSSYFLTDSSKYTVDGL